MTINLLDKIKDLTSRVLQFLRIKTKKEIAETLSSYKNWEKVVVIIKWNPTLWVICGKIGDSYIVWYYSGSGQQATQELKTQADLDKHIYELSNFEKNIDDNYKYKIWTEVKIKTKKGIKKAYIISYDSKSGKYIIWYVEKIKRENINFNRWIIVWKSGDPKKEEELMSTPLTQRELDKLN